MIRSFHNIQTTLCPALFVKCLLPTENIELVFKGGATLFLTTLFVRLPIFYSCFSHSVWPSSQLTVEFEVDHWWSRDPNITPPRESD